VNVTSPLAPSFFPLVAYAALGAKGLLKIVPATGGPDNCSSEVEERAMSNPVTRIREAWRRRRPGMAWAALVALLAGAAEAQPPLDDRSAETAAALIGRWEQSAIVEAGRCEQVPPGNYIVFRRDGKLAFGCDQPLIPYRVGEHGTVVDLEIDGSKIKWHLVGLTPKRLVFVEGGDIFILERREDCP